MSRRRGFTLIEALVVMAGLAMLLGVCAVLLHSLLRLERVGRRHVDDAATLDRLAWAVRDDAHAARSAEVPPALEPAPEPKPGEPAAVAPAVVFERPDGSAVEYRIRGPLVVRTVRDDGEPIAEDRFELPARSTPSLTVADDRGRRVAAFVLDAPTGYPAAGPWRGTRVEAVVGRDHRFEEAPR